MTWTRRSTLPFSSKVDLKLDTNSVGSRSWIKPNGICQGCRFPQMDAFSLLHLELQKAHPLHIGSCWSKHSQLTYQHFVQPIKPILRYLTQSVFHELFVSVSNHLELTFDICNLVCENYDG